MKRPKLLPLVAAGLTAGSAHRQIARSARCAKTSVTRSTERLGRHALLFHAFCLKRLPRIEEPVAHDHFESFVGRQDHALGVGTAVGTESWLLYDVDPAPHRGSGRRPDRIDRRPPVPDRPYVASIRRTFLRLMARIPEPDRLIALVDGRIDYTAALRHEDLAKRTDLRVYPNPKRGPKGSPRSPQARARDFAMFPVDQLHQLVRHTSAEHRRETIAFGRRIESVLGRAHLIAVWKNFIKGRSERKPDRSTPAMHVGLARSPWIWERLLSRRLFFARVGLSASAAKLYRKAWTPDRPALELKHAF